MASRTLIVYFLVGALSFLHVRPSAGWGAQADALRLSCGYSLASKARPVSPVMEKYRRMGYVTVSYSSPVRQQCSDTCWLNAALTQVESYLGIPLSADFYYLSLLRNVPETLDYILKEPRPERDQFEKLGFTNSLRGAHIEMGYSLIGREGLVPANKFRWPANLEKILRQEIQDLNLVGRDEKGQIVPLQTADLLNIQIGRLFLRAKQEILLGQDYETVKTRAQTQIGFYLALAGSGFNPSWKRVPVILNSKLRARILKRERGGHLLESTRAEMEDFVRAQIRLEIPPAVEYIYSRTWDWAQAPIARSPRPIRQLYDEMVLRDLRRHSLVIMGYCLGADRKIESVLLKDSHGADGFREFEAETFFALVRTMESFSPWPSAAAPNSP